MENNKKAENNLTELVMILDKSGSMAGLVSDTIGGFNAMIEKQKSTEGEVFVTTVLFDNESVTVHDRISIEKIEPMTEKEYCPGGCTALLDAVGSTLKHIENIHRYIRSEDIPAHTIFVIMTDGMENASREFSSGDVKRLIEAKKELGWEFIFLGANIDAVTAAGNIGIKPERAVRYKSDKRGTRLSYKVVANALCEMRCGEVPVDASWKEEIEQDVKKRGK